MRSRKWLLGLAPLALAAVALGANDSRFMPRSLDDCGGTCFPCGEFKTRLVINPGLWWPYDYPCVQVSCPNMCQEGPGGDEEPVADVITALEASALQGDAEAIGRVLRNDGRVELNVDRGSVQVIGCSDAVVANIALDATALQQLADD